MIISFPLHGIYLNLIRGFIRSRRFVNTKTDKDSSMAVNVQDFACKTHSDDYFSFQLFYDLREVGEMVIIKLIKK